MKLVLCSVDRIGSRTVSFCGRALRDFSVRHQLAKRLDIDGQCALLLFLRSLVILRTLATCGFFIFIVSLLHRSFMSLVNSGGSPVANAKPSTPQTRGAYKITKKRSLTSEAADAQASLDVDLTTPPLLASEPSSPMFEMPGISATADARQLSSRSSVHSSPFVPPVSAPLPVRAPPVNVPFAGGRDFCRNLVTCIRLTPAIPQGRMELLQTGMKIELVIHKLPRRLSRGLEDYVNDRAAGCHSRAGFTVERIKLYIQGDDVVLFGKLGTEFDLRALHYVFCDIAAPSDLRYCPTSFPDIATALELAKPWLNQGVCLFILVLHTQMLSVCFVLFSGICA